MGVKPHVRQPTFSATTKERLREIDASLEAYLVTMRRKLQLNIHKKPWRHPDWTMNRLHERILDEWDELGEALADGNPNWIKKEAADVGNFGMMIHDLASRFQRGIK